MTKNILQNFPAVEQEQAETAITVEQSRAIQEVQAAVIMAKKFPRNETAAFNKIIEACKRKSLAETAMYSYPRGTTKVSGVSIRLAETLARYWGNLQFGIVELSSEKGVSDIMAYCWDLESNIRPFKQFKVSHSRYSKAGGVQKLTDPRDIYEMTANQGARRLRGCILNAIPADIIEAAVEECEKTLRGNNKEPLIDRVRACVTKFSEIGVTQEMIEKRFNHSIEAVDVHELVALGKIFNSLRDNMAKIEDFFEKPKAEQPAATEEEGQEINEAQKKLFPAKS
jgi:hypothetical protein